MILDLNKYTVNGPFIREWYRENDQDMKMAIPLIATATNCPCAALCFYLAEEIGFTPELMLQIEKFIKFYGYEHIFNQPENSPFLEKYR